MSLLRLAPFDIETESGRQKERYRLAILAAVTNFLYKIVLMIVMVISVRLTFPYLGVEKYGVWITISGLVGLLNFLDLGVGNALINRVAEVAALKSKKKLSETISGGLFALAIISILIGTLSYLLAIFIPWNTFFKFEDEKIYLETINTIKIFSILFAINMFADGIGKIFYGIQRVYEANLVRSIGALLSLILIWYVIKANGDMSHLLIASMSGLISANFFLLCILIIQKKIIYKNLIKNSLFEFPSLVKIGGQFFFLQVGVTILGSIDNLIIINYLGASTVAIYSVVQKLFQFSIQPCQVINYGLWPAYANAKNHGDANFIIKTFKKSIIFTFLVSGGLGLLLVIFGRPIISYWTNSDINIPYAMLIAYFIWSIVDAVSNAFGMYLNGLSLLKPQMNGLITLIIIGLPLKVYLLSQLGIEAMLIGFSIFFLINHVFWAGYVYRDVIFGKNSV